jgi:hypothetical protein
MDIRLAVHQSPGATDEYAFCALVGLVALAAFFVRVFLALAALVALSMVSTASLALQIRPPRRSGN